MTPENRNLIMAVALSMIVLLGWQMLVIQPEMEREAAEQERIATEMAESGAATLATGQPNVSAVTDTPTIGGSAAAPKAVETAKRIGIDAPLVRGSFSLRGARLDDVVLTGYKESLYEDSDNIHFLQKTSSDMPFFAEFGWSSSDANQPMPNAEAQTTMEEDSQAFCACLIPLRSEPTLVCSL